MLEAPGLALVSVLLSSVFGTNCALTPCLAGPEKTKMFTTLSLREGKHLLSQGMKSSRRYLAEKAPWRLAVHDWPLNRTDERVGDNSSSTTTRSARGTLPGLKKWYCARKHPISVPLYTVLRSRVAWLCSRCTYNVPGWGTLSWATSVSDLTAI